MKDLADKHYKAPSGNNVVLEPDFIPWPDYYTRLAASLTSGEQKYQMAVSDSQWLGANIEGGYYMKLNDFIDADPELQAVFKDLHPTLVSAYSTYPHITSAELAEAGFPHPDANYYGFPQMPDVIIVYYRSDVFCDEGEQAAFKAKYGKDLPCAPEDMNDVDWDMVANFGEFFGRKTGDMLAGETLDDDFYGIAYQAGKGYDFSSMEINGFVWQHGGSIWDETKAPEGQAEGVVNSPESVKGLEHYLSMLKYMPPVVQTGTMDVFKVDELFREGKVAYILQWIGFGESAISAETSKVHDRVGFAMHPGLRMPDGTINRTANIGGQPFVLTTWNSDEVIREAVDFVKWWLSTPVQDDVRPGGRPERPRQRAHRVGLRELPSVEPCVRAEPPMAEGRVAHPRVLRAARPAAGGVRQGHHRAAGRQGGAGRGRRLPAGAPDRGRTHRVAELRTGHPLPANRAGPRPRPVFA